MGSSRKTTSGLGHQRRGEVQPASHAAGVGLRRTVPRLVEVELLEQLPGACPRGLLAEVVEAPHHVEVLVAGQVFVDRGASGPTGRSARGPCPAPRDVDSRHQGRALVRLEQRRQDPNRGRLAGAVRAEQPEHGPLGNRQIEAVERHYLPYRLTRPSVRIMSVIRSPLSFSPSRQPTTHARLMVGEHSDTRPGHPRVDGPMNIRRPGARFLIGHGESNRRAPAAIPAPRPLGTLSRDAGSLRGPLRVPDRADDRVRGPGPVRGGRPSGGDLAGRRDALRAGAARRRGAPGGLRGRPGALDGRAPVRRRVRAAVPQGAAGGADGASRASTAPPTRS